MVATMWRRGLAGLLSVFVFLAGACGIARAQQVLLPSTGAPFIVVQLQSGSVTIHSWPRPTVGLDADPTVNYNHAPPRVVAGRMRQSVMLWSQTIQTPQGPLTLQPEPFPLPAFAPGDHDAYVIRGYGDVTLNVPYATPLVVVNVKIGSVDIAGFHGTFVVHAAAGQVHMDGDSGTGAVQVNNGAFFADQSTFDRLRLRTGRGNVIMTNCRVQQIDVTSLLGSLVFDNGTFSNGIARFESERGAVAIGVNGGAQIEAHSGNGRIVYDENDVSVQRAGFDAEAQINGGGPVVTATSAGAAVVIYSGSLRDHPDLEREMPPQLRFF